MNSIKRFLKNKNTVTVIGIIVIVGLLWGVYTYQINKQVKPKSVPVASQDIQPRTKITADMVKYVDMPEAYISDNALTDQSAIVGKYSNFNTVIPANSMFYQSTVTEERALPNYMLKQLKDGEYLINYIISASTTAPAWGIMPGDKIDLYMRVTSDEGSVMLGRFLENVEVLDVLDSAGQSVYDVSDGSRTPYSLIFAAQEDLFLLLLRSNYLNIDLFPVQHGAWMNDSEATIKMTTQELIDYIKSRVVQLSTDPVSGQIRKAAQ